MKKTFVSVSLHQLVDQLTASLLPRTTKQRSFIVNDVQREMLVSTDKNILATVISNLLNTTLAHTQSNCIRISAKLFGNIVLLQVKDTDNRHDEAITGSLPQVEYLAEKIGGCVTLTSNKLKGTTVVFSFYNQQQAA